MTFYANPFQLNGTGPYQLVSGVAAIYIGKIPVADTIIAQPSFSSAGIAQVDTSTYKFLGFATDTSDYMKPVEVTLGASYKDIESEGTTLIRKVLRTKEDYSLKTTIMATTLELIQYALNGNAITTTAASTGVAGTKQISFQQGFFTQPYTIVAVTPSPYGAFQQMFYFPRMVNETPSKLMYGKSDVANFDLEFKGILEPSLSLGAQAGNLIAVTAPGT